MAHTSIRHVVKDILGNVYWARETYTINGVRSLRLIPISDNGTPQIADFVFRPVSACYNLDGTPFASANADGLPPRVIGPANDL